ncbi:unnamed protein product [Onchocerca flexuosa]|uniref:DUF4417 domain-containing protein n=1 Tax=Onchocerca flexuosa TaxID=387005 RepID=A0A183I7Q8_9BILA|nr:unnamed protein product [Onchocerca flexuosa]
MNLQKALQRWQPRFALLFADINNPTPTQYMPFDCLYFQIVPYNDRLGIFLNFRTDGTLGENHPRSAVIIPKMYDVPVKFMYCGDHNNWCLSTDGEWSTAMRNAKLIILFRTTVREPYDIESVINTEIAPYIENQSVSICFAHQLDEAGFHG